MCFSRKPKLLLCGSTISGPECYSVKNNESVKIPIHEKQCKSVAVLLIWLYGQRYGDSENMKTNSQ